MASSCAWRYRLQVKRGSVGASIARVIPATADSAKSVFWSRYNVPAETFKMTARPLLAALPKPVILISSPTNHPAVINDPLDLVSVFTVTNALKVSPETERTRADNPVGTNTSQNCAIV